MAIIAPIVSTFDNKGLRQAEGAFSRFGRTVGAQLKNLATAAAGIGVALSAGAVKAISAASDLDEAISATRQIFGDAADSVLAFADDAATALGISKQEALDGALVFGTYGKAAGLAGDELSDFTNDFLGLASDLASFRNSSPEEVIEAIGAALRGESEPLRRYGVLLDDATLKAEALALGIYSGNGRSLNSRRSSPPRPPSTNRRQTPRATSPGPPTGSLTAPESSEPASPTSPPRSGPPSSRSPSASPASCSIR
jgi:hypothetical protein